MKMAIVKKIGFLFFVKSGDDYITCKESREEAELYAYRWNKKHGFIS